MEAERLYALENRSPNSVPAEADKLEPKDLIARLAATLRDELPWNFKAYIDFVKNNVLYTTDANDG